MSKLKKQWYENVVTVFKAHLRPWAFPFHPPLGSRMIPDSYSGAQLLQQVPVLCQSLSAPPPLPVPPALRVVALDYAAGSVQSSGLQVLSCCFIILSKANFLEMAWSSLTRLCHPCILYTFAPMLSYAAARTPVWLASSARQFATSVWPPTYTPAEEKAGLRCKQ